MEDNQESFWDWIARRDREEDEKDAEKSE